MSPNAANEVTVLEEPEVAEHTEEEVLEYAEFLGIDVQQEPHLMWIAREGIAATLPPGWKACQQTGSDEIFYFNFETQESVWEHPCDTKYVELLQEERQKHQAGNSGVASIGPSEDGIGSPVEKTANGSMDSPQSGITLSPPDSAGVETTLREPREPHAQPRMQAAAASRLTSGGRRSPGPDTVPEEVAEEIDEESGLSVSSPQAGGGGPTPTTDSQPEPWLDSSNNETSRSSSWLATAAGGRVPTRLSRAGFELSGTSDDARRLSSVQDIVDSPEVVRRSSGQSPAADTGDGDRSTRVSGLASYKAKSPPLLDASFSLSGRYDAKASTVASEISEDFLPSVNTSPTSARYEQGRPSTPMETTFDLSVSRLSEQMDDIPEAARAVVERLRAGKLLASEERPGVGSSNLTAKAKTCEEEVASLGRCLTMLKDIRQKQEIFLKLLVTGNQ